MSRFTTIGLIEYLQKDLQWNNCEECKLFRQLNCWFDRLICRDCIKRSIDV